MSQDGSTSRRRPGDSPGEEARVPGRVGGARRALPAAKVSAAGALRMPASGGEGGGPSRDELHEFHLAGRPEAGRARTVLRPAALEAAARSRGALRGWPLLLAGDGDLEVRPLRDAIDAALEGAGSGVPLVDRHAEQLCAGFAVAAADAGSLPRLDEIADAASRAFRDGFDRSDAADEALRDELGRVLLRLPQDATVVPFGPQAALRLQIEALRRERARRAAAVRAEIDGLRAQLDALLRADARHAPGESSESRLSSSLGPAGSGFVDPAKLSANLPGYRGAKRLTPDRRARIVACATRLAAGADEILRDEPVRLLHAGALPENATLDGASVERRDDALSAAARAFEGVATRLVDLCRAIRLARLELAGAYQPRRHDAVLERLDWQGLTAEELALAPRIVVLETAARVGGPALGAFSSLLRSGLPIHVLVLDELGAADGRADLATFHAQLGYLSIAHREAYVLQSTLALPGHLAGGFARMARSMRPGVAIVAVPTWSSPVEPWAQLVAAHAGRATPTMRHDPEAGTSWAHRFDLSGNRDPESDWPVVRVEITAADGVVAALELAITFADAAALDPALGRHLHTIPPAAWDDSQLELADYLELEEDARGYRLPYIWTIGEDGVLQRAIVSRELAFASLDRVRAWRVLQELAGTKNEYARRASEAARRQTLAEATKEKDALQADIDERLAAARTEGAVAAIERLVAALTGTASAPAGAESSAAPGGPASPPSAEPAIQTPPPATAPAPAAEEEAPEPPAEAADAGTAVDAGGEPYIDSFLCTTCNECTNLNPRLFRYDANNQAYIADASAGTFEELVIAAEKCPARCIHPGAPRPGDGTATEELIARASPFA